MGRRLWILIPWIMICLMVIPACGPSNSLKIVAEWLPEKSLDSTDVRYLGHTSINDREYLFIGNYSQFPNERNILAIDIHNPEKPQKVSSLKIPDRSPTGLSVISGTVLYIPLYDSLWILDISNPLEIKEINRLFTVQAGAAMFFGKYLYIFDKLNQDTLTILDISSPRDPRIVGSMKGFEGSSFGLNVSGSILYSLGADAIHIFEISSPFSLKEISKIPNPSYRPRPLSPIIPFGFSDMAVVPPYLYIASGTMGMRTFDISQPEKPFEITNTSAKINTEKKVYADSIVVDGDYAYLIENDINCVNIKDIQDPVILSTVSLPLQAKPDGTFNYRSFIKIGNYIYCIATIARSGNPSTTAIEIVKTPEFKSH